ncbi:uncharacterized protein EDB93DRAFT_608132 [Suillus bovinus]|uniref:uncharacterized protein n=1 Tax=Suillus bovinus TaxID=48563 RepID=UPI001B87B404|nr:uncharacterized protein EDB93DRAFT_608132 [Suillus bovinus]KAG2142219.1 hypothetical protein EDB93DRAFT_608132 [Suillus bovinus]
MRFSVVLTVVAALTASISASDAASDASASCPFFCVKDSTCSHCEGGFCVSSHLYPGINHMTHWRDHRASLYATSMVVSRVSAFVLVQYG